jgi:hypothetical protein
MQTLKHKILPLCRPLRLAAAVSLIWIPLAIGSSAHVSAQQAVPGTEASAAAPVVPQQVRYAGKLVNRTGDTVEAVFRIYAAAEGGEPLWTETQRVAVGEDGSYTVLLGSAEAKGLPQSVFAGGVARWLGISVEQAPEQARAMLASVPYAMKSADSEALAGHAAADFVTQEQLAALTAQGEQPVAAAAPDGIKPLTSGTITGSGATGNVALFTGANTVGNANIVEVGNDIGINETAPAAMLDVNGTETVRGTLTLPPTATATTTSGYPSQHVQMNSSVWSTTTNAAGTDSFTLTAFPSGNNTATPSSSLLLLHQPAGGSASGILSIANTGVISFAPGQTFPGTLTSATANSPLIVSLAGHNLGIEFSYAALTTLLNSTYAQFFANNTFHGSQTIQGNLTLTAALDAQSAALTGAVTAAKGFQGTGPITATPLNLATAATAQSSPQFELGASAFNSGTAAAVAQNFAWQTQATGNNTASPSANLALLFGAGTASPTATGLSIAPNGNINFSPSQVFPIKGTGGGTITGITTTSPLTGSGTAGSVALGLNTSALETTLNSVYAKLSGGNIFTSYLEAYQTAGPGNAALLGWGTNGSVGVFGDSDTGYGLQGVSTSGYGAYAHVVTPSAGSAGVLGFTGTGFSTNYSSEAGVADAGVWADSSAAGTGIPVALFATADDAYGAVIVTNGAGFPGLFVDNAGGTAGEFQSATGYGVYGSTSTGTGVYGSTGGGGNGVEGVNSSLTEQEAGVLGVGNTTSATGATYNIYSGIWGDTGTSSTTVSPAWAIGVLGTADDSHAGVFLNNSTGWSTLYASNADTGGSGLFKTFMAKSADGTCGIGGGGSLSCTGPIKGLVSAGGARTVETYSVQSPENWMEDFGSGEMHNGVAIVTIDAAFAETVTGDASYHVFITPNGDSKGLYVTAKTANTFEVRESSGGTSSLSFDYRIVAKRRGFEAQRLVDVTERFNTEQAAATMNKASGIRHEPAPLARSPLIAGLNSHPRRITATGMNAPAKPVERPSSTPPHQ